MIQNLVKRRKVSVFLWLLVLTAVGSVISAVDQNLVWYLLLGDVGVIAWRLATIQSRINPIPEASVDPQDPGTPPAYQPPPSPRPRSTFRPLRVDPVGSSLSAQGALDELDRMVGLAAVKRELNKIMASAQVEQRRRASGLSVSPVSRHMVFTGPPGVGKTVVARTLGAIYRDLGVLPRGHVIETDRSGLVAEYIGQTAQKTKDRINEAMGGILFIDEAYTLAAGRAVQGDFGQEAIDTLLKAMEDYRERLVVIVAGYPAQIGQFLSSNPGLASRFPKTIPFPAYTADELLEILKRMLKKEQLRFVGDQARMDSMILNWLTSRSRDPGFGNAREVRTLVERIREAQAVRLANDPSGDLQAVTDSDIQEALEI
ncbi:AAA family ATPase [Methylacidimicrobium tartarophylax]|uniref:Stage V sporulation protein K n=1 Tax=Methylacidimicrobium tartarophylax TaxID=1041768 RepID=A0A5E6MD31_9BACT|nr:AAA family ATPase [Methylacidimicrobium tartarophylax]VVM06236.1 Stage V sporulation protein K [Methylacidimicrobium tartarophylax]